MDQNGNVIYDEGISLFRKPGRRWRALWTAANARRSACRMQVSIESGVFDSARIKPAVIQVESHPYLPQTELLEFCNGNGIVMLAFAPLGHAIAPGLLEDHRIIAIAKRVNKTAAQVLLAWAVQRGTAVLTTPRTPDRAKENFDLSALPEDAMQEINAIQTRQRFNPVTETGVPGFIKAGS